MSSTQKKAFAAVTVDIQRSCSFGFHADTKVEVFGVSLAVDRSLQWHFLTVPEFVLCTRK